MKKWNQFTLPIRSSNVVWVSKLSCFLRMNMLEGGVIDSSKSSVRRRNWLLMDFLLKITYATMLIPHKTTSNRKHQHNNWNLSIYQQFHMRFKKMFFLLNSEKNLLWFVQLGKSNILKKLTTSANGCKWLQISGKQYELQASLWQNNCKCCKNHTFKKISSMTVKSWMILCR